jgi:hypothetical protein
MKKLNIPLGLFAILVCLVMLLSACVKLKPGADPLVVRTEQLETTAYSTFDTFLKLDDVAMANSTVEPTWSESAHPFATYLRKPITVGTNTVPFGIASVLSLDTIKLSYQSGESSSNALLSAITVLETTVSQASQYTSLISTNH